MFLRHLPRQLSARARHIHPMRDMSKLALNTSGQRFSTDSQSISEKTSQALLKHPECAYIVPLYVGQDGGHDRILKEWMKQEGDAVAPQDVLCEIDTTEFSYDYTSEVEGYLVHRTIAEGGDLGDEQLVALVVPSSENLEDYQERFEAMYKLLEEEEEREKVRSKDAATTKVREEDVEEMVKRVLAMTELVQYKEVFRKLVDDDGFDTACAMQAVTEDDLEECGIEKKGHRRALVVALQQKMDE